MRHVSLRAVATALLLLSLVGSAAAGEVRWNAEKLYERSVAQHVRLVEKSLRLERGELIEDDGPAAGYSYLPNQEKLAGETCLRKELDVPNPATESAQLLISGSGDFRLEVNGKEVASAKPRRAANHWDAYDIPAQLLRAGMNSFVIRGTGNIWIAREDEFARGAAPQKPLQRSARSTDNGKTWQVNQLGPEGKIAGEYSIRLWLDHHRQRGTLTLPVLDILNLEEKLIAPASSKSGTLQVKTKSQSGESSTVLVRVRYGGKPIVDAKWSRWQTLGDEPIANAARWFQLMAELETGDPLASPQLEELTITSTATPDPEWAKDIKIVAVNQPIVRSAIPFVYEAFDQPELKQLRTDQRLDEVVAGAETELEQIEKLALWSAKRWERGHLGEGYPPWNALEIMKASADGSPVGGFCQQYNIVFLQACESFGIPGRCVSIGPGGLVDKPRRGGHEVVELWSNQFNKWIYVDGQFAWYGVDSRSRIPLSLLELRERQLKALAGKPALLVDIVKVGKVPARAKEDWTEITQGLPFGELRMIPRSNFLAEQSPLPLNQGMRGWSWTGHYVWSDDKLPAGPIYSGRVSQRSNWEWTLNQTHIRLLDPCTPGQLRMYFDTETPGFETFVASINGEAEKPVASGDTWSLSRGENRLRVYARNKAGRKGPESSVTLLWKN